MSKITIRSLGESDIKAAASLVQTEWPDFVDDFHKELKRYQQSGEGDFFVALKNNTIVGLGAVIVSEMSYAVWNITWLLVDPSIRGQGIGTLMVAELEKFVLDHKDRREHTLAITITTGVNHFYERIGYESVKKFDGRDGATKHLMWKNLMLKFIIRPANMPDLIICHRIMEECPELHTQGHAPNMWWLSSFIVERKTVLVAEENGKVIGCLFAERISGGVFLVHLWAVDRNNRGRGIGEALLDRAEQIAKENGYVGVMTYAYSEGKAPVCILEKRGYIGDNLYREYWKRCDGYKENENENER